jgi:hypothetical protein
MGSTRLRIEQVPTKAQLGLDNVDNTADADKPISTAVQTALDEKEDSGNKKQVVNAWETAQYPSSAAVAAFVDGQIGNALSTAFVREFPNIVGLGVEVAQSPSIGGSGLKRTFTLTWDALGWQWVIACWAFSVYDNRWDVIGSVVARDLHWVAIEDGDGIAGYYVMGVHREEFPLPKWEVLGPDISNFYTKGEVDTALGNKADAASLAAVATSGAYADLTGKPAIPPAYTLPAATAGTLGGIKVGNNLTVAADGTLSAAAVVEAEDEATAEALSTANRDILYVVPEEEP